MMATNPMSMKLKELQLTTTYAWVTAIILSKSKPVFFVSKDSGENCGVITLTIRDTEEHIVNCKCWDNQEQIIKYAESLKIGDIVDVICQKVVPQKLVRKSHQLTQNYEWYHPLATLPFMLVLHKNRGTLNKHHNRDADLCRELRHLLHVPHKPLCRALNLVDVSCTLFQRDAKGQYVDLLVMLAAKRQVRRFKLARSSITQKCLELIVYDKSFLDGMVMAIWNEDWIERAMLYWKPHKTVLHLIDIKVMYSEFHKANKLNFAHQTLVYENPLGEEAQALQIFSAKMPLKDYDIFAQAGAETLPSAEQITTQMSVRQIYARAESEVCGNIEQFTAALYATLIKFDIDGLAPILSKKCKSCQRLIPTMLNECQVEQCQLAFSLNHDDLKYDYFYNINVYLADVTGTLVEARLTGEIAERLMGVSAKQFQQMSVDNVEELKWRFLMRIFEAKLLIKKATAVRRSLTVIVIDMRPIELAEFMQKVVAC